MEDHNSTVPQAPARRRLASLAVLAVLASTLCFYGLGANGVHERDEASHAQLALEMFRSGEWWQPTAFGHPTFNKPALMSWLTTATYELLGPTVFASRLWAAVFAVAAVLATYALGERIGGVRVGLLAGVALSSSYLFVYRHCARTFEFDSLLVLSFVASSALFLRAVETNRGWVMCAVVAAVASHAKNFAGLVPAAVFVLTLLFSRGAQQPSRRVWMACGIAFVTVNLAWVVPMWALHGRPFVDQYVGDQLLLRPFLPESFNTPQVARLYFATVVCGLFPWALLGMCGLAEDGRKAWSVRDPASILVWGWMLILALVLCWGLRRGYPWYVIPLAPFLAVSGSRCLLANDTRPAWATWWQRVACLAVAAVTVCVQLRADGNPFSLWSIAHPSLMWSTPTRIGLLILAALVAGAAALTRSERSRRMSRVLTWPAVTVLTVAALVAVGRPLGAVGYQNVYVRTREALIQARSGRPVSVIVHVAGAEVDDLTRYYFDNIEQVRATYQDGDRAAAIAAAVSAPAPTFLVLVTLGATAPVTTDLPGPVIFAAHEVTPRGLVFVVVVEVKGTEANHRVSPGLKKRLSQ